MTDDNLTRHIGSRKQITTTVGSHAFHYKGIIKSVSSTHITILDDLVGEVDIPISDALIRGMD